MESFQIKGLKVLLKFGTIYEKGEESLKMKKLQNMNLGVQNMKVGETCSPMWRITFARRHFGE